MYVCMYVCMHACMHVCVYVCVCMCMYACVYACDGQPLMYACMSLYRWETACAHALGFQAKSDIIHVSLMTPFGVREKIGSLKL